MAERVNVRLLCFETLLEIKKQNTFVKDSLNKTLFQNQFLEKQERAFLTRLTEGVTEYQIRLDYIINQYSKIKTNRLKPAILIILRMGVYQMLFMNQVPVETACDESVKLARKKGFHNLTGFVNGVLRTISKNLDDIEYPDEHEDAEYAMSVFYSVPEWLVSKMFDWYGEKLTKQILEASVSASELTVRINENQVIRETLIHKMQEKKIDVTDGNYVPYALHLKHINYILKVPGFKEGEFFVQDESSMLLYEVVRNEIEEMKKSFLQDETIKVLDLCSAPGGKATHFAENLCDKGMVYAKDISENKIQLIEENIRRLHLNNVKTEVFDATETDESAIKAFDIVLADLPCSGLGIMGKKNDIKYHISKEQLEELSVLQRRILENAIQYVKPKGILLFSTCTINPKENIENARWIAEHKEYTPYPFSKYFSKKLQPAFIEDHILQLLQGRELCDGFFISAFQRSEKE